MKNYQRAFKSVLVGFKLGKDDDFGLAYALLLLTCINNRGACIDSLQRMLQACANEETFLYMICFALQSQDIIRRLT
jgi:hypothetical protein